MVLVQTSFYDSLGHMIYLGRKLRKVVWSWFVYVNVQSVIAWNSTHTLIAYVSAFILPLGSAAFLR